MDLPKEMENLKRPGKIPNIVLSILLILAVICIAFLVYLKNQNIDIRDIDVKQVMHGNLSTLQNSKPKENSSEIKYDIKEHSVFCTYRESIIKCTGENIYGLNRAGEDQWNIDISMANPVLKTAGPYLLAYDSGGRDIYVIEGKNVKWNKKIENTIINADISSSGYVSAVHEMKGYKSAVTVYNLMGGEIFTRNIAESFVLSAKVSPKSNQVLINSVDASGISANTSLEFTDIFGKPFAAKIPEENQIFPSIWYVNKECLLAVSDSTMLYFDKDRQVKWKQEFKERKVYSSGIFQNRYAVIALSGGNNTGILNNASEVEIFDPDGKLAASCQLNNEVKSMQTGDDLIAVNTGREVDFINSKGKLVWKYNPKVDVSEVYFLNKKEAVFVTKNSIIVSKIG